MPSKMIGARLPDDLHAALEQYATEHTGGDISAAVRKAVRQLVQTVELIDAATPDEQPRELAAISDIEKLPTLIDALTQSWQRHFGGQDGD